MLKITLKRSVVGNTPTNRRTVKALGLRKTGRTVYHTDTPSVRGMLRNIQHLLKVEVVTSAPEKKVAAKAVVKVAPAPKVVAPKAEAPKTKKPAAKEEPVKAAAKKEKKEPAASTKTAKKPAKK